jgi:hypothetical protein
MSKYSETRTLGADKLREACIRHNLYTRGTNEEYENLFARLTNEHGSRVEMTTDKLEEIMEDIMAHSDYCDDMWNRIAVMQWLSNACDTRFFLK